MDFSTFSPALVLVTVISLALAPFVAVMVTSFTKMVVVLSLLRNALGLQQVPPNVVINGLAIVLSIYVMYPVILDTHAAVEAKMKGLPPPASISAPARPNTPAAPLPAAPPAAAAPVAATGAAALPDPAPRSPAAAAGLAAEAAATAAAARGSQFANVLGTNASMRGPQFANVQSAPPAASASAAAPGAAAPPADVVIAAPAGPAPAPAGGRMDTARLLSLVDAGKEPLRGFLTKHSSDAERAFFLRSAQRLLPPARRADLTAEDFIVIIPAFTVSELTAAFQIGFLIFLPFLIIDLVVSNILLALGMMMLSPTTVSLPFKLLLFVLIDGWAKLVHGLVLTYAT